MINIFRVGKEKIKTSLHNSKSYRNKQTINGKKVVKHRVNIEYSNFPVDAPLNIGDTLTPVVFEYIKNKYSLVEKKLKQTTHLNMIGSIIAFKKYDAVIWGSGILNEDFERKIKFNAKHVKYDIRAVRGPLTRDILIRCGYDCPNVFGDPAILMPLIYKPKNKIKKYKISIIKHYRDDTEISNGLHEISVVTSDYKYFIDEICASELVVSSSLHGLIIAESFGVPTIWYNPQGRGTFKYKDWYLSIGINDPAVINNISEIGEKRNVGLDSKISQLVEPLMDSFPFELWSKKQ